MHYVGSPRKVLYYRVRKRTWQPQNSLINTASVILPFDDAERRGYSPRRSKGLGNMFIVHGKWLRKHARWILAGILFLLGPGLIFLFSPTGGGGRRRTERATQSGQAVNAAAG